MISQPTQSRSNALRDLIISVIWIALCIFFLDVDYNRIVSLRAAGSPVPVMRWVQAPLWIAMFLFWLRNGWKAWQRFRANDSRSR